MDGKTHKPKSQLLKSTKKNNTSIVEKSSTQPQPQIPTPKTAKKIALIVVKKHT